MTESGAVHETIAGSGPAIEVVGVTKAFPGVLANDRIDLSVYAGEVHCVLGENGAGKSTLMNILSGMVQPDEGRILVHGVETQIDSPRRSLEVGIGMVYQHSTLIPTLSVLENLMIGTNPGLTLDRRACRARLVELAAALGIEIDGEATAGSLALGQQQQLEIIKALWRGSDILILDEPTSMLPPQGVAELAKVLAGLKAQGLATILITHKLHEAVEMGDRISILKQGRRVGSLDPDELRSRTAHEAHDAIIGMMFGGEAATVAGVSELREEADAHRRARDVRGAPLLELIHVSARGDRHGWGIDDVTLDVLEGEILGIAGVDGNGQKELAEAIAGQRRLSAGEIRLDGRSVSTLSVAQRERRGLRYVTDDRLGEGTVRGLSVAMNLVVKRIGQAPFWRRGTTRHVPINAAATKLVDEFDVRTPSVSTRVSTLSGGNLQKVVLARELSFDPRVVVYSKPTHGLDVKTTLFVRERIRQQADQGLAQLVISTDLEELLDLCDRIAVMFRGRCAGVVDNAPGIEQTVGELIMGGRAA